MNRIPGELQAGGTVLVLGTNVPVRGQGPDGVDGNAVDVLVRPEGLKMEVTEHGNGIVTTRTFLGSVTRVGVQLSTDVAVRIDKSSVEAAALAPGTSVSVTLPPEAVHVVPRSAS
jgi:putative spermidine/putrescine transport system ATP-binding protein